MLAVEVVTEAEKREPIIRGDVLRRLREARGWTQGELAYHSDVDQSQISKIESGQLTDVLLSTAKRLALALGCSLDELAGLKPEAPSLLPEFHWYISRKFGDDPRLRQTLIQVYEAIQSVKEERKERRRRREQGG